MKNGRFEPKDESLSKRDKDESGAGNCSYSSFVTLVLGASGPASLESGSGLFEYCFAALLVSSGRVYDQ